MKNLLYIFSFILVGMLLGGCEAIGDIFGAGVYTGMFLVVAVIVIIVVVVAKMNKK